MQKRWLGQNIDLNQLTMYAEDFLKSKGFVTRKHESKGEHVVTWAPQHVDNISKTMYKAMKLRIFGEPKDFVVDLVASQGTRGSIRFGMLTQAIGGGYVALQGSRLREELEKLESDFWIYIETKIAQMASQG